MLTLDTNGIADEDEPFIDVCYVSDMLVNMIAGDSQQLGMPTPLVLANSLRCIYAVEF